MREYRRTDMVKYTLAWCYAPNVAEEKGRERRLAQV